MRQAGTGYPDSARRASRGTENHDGRHSVTARLRASSLDALTIAETDDDRHTVWSRVRVNWEALADHPDSIENIRKTILDLGVRGKLVSQDADDGSAAYLLGLIAAEKQLQGLRAGMKREAESHFKIPPTWSWTMFGFVTDTRLGKGLKT